MSSFDGIVGQRRIKDCLNLLLSNNRVLPHCLFIGPAGYGKTSFANAICNEIKSEAFILNAANISTFKSLVPTLLRIKEQDILFIDEIHRLNNKMQECFYTILQENKVSSNGLHTIYLPKFTVLGATTDIGLLTKPMLDRFPYKFIMDDYTDRDIISIIKRLKKFKIDDVEVLKHIIYAGKYIPRLTIHYISWLNQYVKQYNINALHKDLANDAFAMLGIDNEGLDMHDTKYLKFLKDYKKPIGVKTIAANINIPVETIEHHIEPYLLRRGKIIKTPFGRQYNES